jgi:myxalamid-type polyketide synthase MxaE and MxaD
VAAELHSPEAEYHVAWRGSARLVARLTRRTRPVSAKPPIDANATYLVAGGLGALGLRLASWLVDEGARHLLLTGRRSPGEDALSVVRALEAKGAEVSVVSADVSTGAGVAAVMEKARALPPLKGVVNAAGVLDDGVLLQQNRERFEKVLGPKVLGSFRLHEATRDLGLDFFVCFSSAAALFGSAGQANYAAANAFMDALAAHRRASGLPGLSVAWGAWAETGMAANLTSGQRQKLAERGVGEIEPRQGLRLLGDLIAEGRAHAGVSPMNWAKYFAGVSKEQVLPYFERLAPASAAAAPKEASRDVLAELRHAPASERREIVGRYVLDRVARILGYEDPSQVDRDLTLLELGFDSLMAVQLRNQVRTGLGTDVPIGKLFDSTGVDALAALLEQKLDAAPASNVPREHVEVI